MGTLPYNNPQFAGTNYFFNFRLMFVLIEELQERSCAICEESCEGALLGLLTTLGAAEASGTDGGLLDL